MTTIKEREDEVVLYATMSAVNGLELANNIEHHEDYIIRLLGDSKMRLRVLTIDNETRYLLTIKKHIDITQVGTSRYDEYTTEVDEVFLEGYKAQEHDYVKKTRYTFINDTVSIKYSEDGTERSVRLPPMAYEVDVFDNVPDMAKIEVELQDILAAAGSVKDINDKNITLELKLAELPPKFIGVFSDATDTDKVEDFWKRVKQKE